MSSYDVAMDLLRLDDEDFAEVFAWIAKADYQVDELDKADIKLERRDMIDAIDTNKLTKILQEIIVDPECYTNAWWKTQPKKAFLSKDAEFQQRRLMESAVVINNIYRRMEDEGKIDTSRFNGDIMEVITDLAREFEYTFFETDEYEDGYVELLEGWLPFKLKEVFA